MTDDRDRRLDAAVELMIEIAAGNLDARKESSDAGDQVDALVVGLNMLAEELATERSGRADAEAKLRDELDAYERAPGLFASVDAKTDAVLRCNETFARKVGRPKSEIIGRSIVDLHAPSSREPLERLLRATRTDGPAGSGEVDLLGADGLLITADLDVTRVGTDGDERFRIIWRDISAEKELEQQLLQAQKMEAIGRLSGGVAHDFNNLLAVIMNAAALLREELEAHPHARSFDLGDLATLEQAAKRGAALTNDLLAFSRQRVVRPEPTDVCDVVADTERMIRRLIGEDIQLELVIEERPAVVVIDPSQLSQVLINLAINARDAMPNGGRLTIETLSRTIETEEAERRIDLEPGPHIVLAVTDTGTGMPQDVAAQAFEPFFSTKPFGSGTGLGLSTCYGIVRQAGGRIAIYSEVSAGTTVRVYLPVHRGAATPPSGVPRSRVAGGSERILLVEDDTAVRSLTSRVLERAGYDITVAENGEIALDRIGDGALDLLVTDVMMPVMGGRELADRLRETRPDLRVLYLSGYTANSIVKHGVLEPNIEFLAKPFTPAALLAAVRAALDRSTVE